MVVLRAACLLCTGRNGFPTRIPLTSHMVSTVLLFGSLIAFGVWSEAASAQSAIMFSFLKWPLLCCWWSRSGHLGAALSLNVHTLECMECVEFCQNPTPHTYPQPSHPIYDISNLDSTFSNFILTSNLGKHLYIDDWTFGTSPVDF